MKLSDLDYPLPEALIAQHPVRERSASRLMVVHRATGHVEHRHFYELPELAPPGSCLFRNNASVFKARLRGRRPTGGAIECLLLKPLDGDSGGEEWECLLKPGRKCSPGSTFGQESAYQAEVLAKLEDGTYRVRLTPSPPHTTVVAMANAYGAVPLPPYIKRSPEAACPEDDTRYQTVYADPGRMVAAAAPTAGLHFTPEILDNMQARGHQFADLTLHVGLGTFLPIQAEEVEDHPIHSEFYEIPAETSRILTEADCPRLAVGTTAVRAIEDYIRYRPTAGPGQQETFGREARLYITPPFSFLGVDALITNFHLPKSTLLALVGAFLTPGSRDGIPWIKELYAEAVDRRYRFFSYGDAMFIL